MSKYAAKSGVMKKSIFKSKKSEKKTEDGTAGVGDETATDPLKAEKNRRKRLQQKERKKLKIVKLSAASRKSIASSGPSAVLCTAGGSAMVE